MSILSISDPYIISLSSFTLSSQTLRKSKQIVAAPRAPFASLGVMILKSWPRAFFLDNNDNIKKKSKAHNRARAFDQKEAEP